MLSLLLCILLILLITKSTDNPFPRIPFVYTKYFCSLFITVLIVALTGGLTEAYYRSNLPSVEYNEIDIHYETRFGLDDYVKGGDLVVMDKDHNIYNIDLSQSEITFSNNSDKLYLVTKRAKGIFNLLLLEYNRTSYSVQFYDPYMRTYE